MNKYLTIDDRLNNLNKWLQIATKLCNEIPSDTKLCNEISSNNNNVSQTNVSQSNEQEAKKIVLDENLNIKNDISDFIEKINVQNGSMVILKSLKGTFGFPFEIVLDDFMWFSKLTLYDIGQKLPKLDMPSNYLKLPYIDKIEFHKKLIAYNNISVNTEQVVNAKLTQLVKDKINPHICLLYGATELYDKKHQFILETFIKRYKKSDRENLVNAGKVLMSEWADLGDLSEYINNNMDNWDSETWTVVLFQLIAMLALINEKYPSFRHNDLSLPNILVQKTQLKPLEPNEYPGYYKYNIFGKTYCLPDIGFRLLLTDLDYATMKEFNITHEKIANDYTKKFGVSDDPNPSYDCHMALNWLDFCVLQLGLYNKHNPIPEELVKVKEFIFDIIEEQYRGENNRNLKFHRFRIGKKIVDKLLPENILNHKYFDKFRNYEDWIKDRELIEEYNIKIKTIEQNE